MHTCPMWPLPFTFINKILHDFLIFHVHITRRFCPILLDFVMISGMLQIRKVPKIAFSPTPYNFLNSIYSLQHLFSSKDMVSDPFKMKENVAFPYNLILLSERGDRDINFLETTCSKHSSH